MTRRLRKLALGAFLSSLWLTGTPSIAQPIASEPPDDAFALRPSVSTQQQTRTNPETGDTVFLAIRLRELIAQAHSVHPRDVRAEGAVDLDKRYDVTLRPGPGASRSQLRALLATGIARSLVLKITQSRRRVPINRLQRLAGEPALTAAEAGEQSIEVERGRFEARRVPIRALAAFLRWRSPRPIVDETGLDDTYDFVLEWDPSGGASALFLALHDLGLVIVRGRDVFPFLLVSPST
jgi:uncharacterized protein (TIGR03435 family)